MKKHAFSVRSVIALLLLLAVLTTGLPAAFADGTFWWVEDRTLMIGGNGEMHDFGVDVAPWRQDGNQGSEIRNIEVQSGVTHVGSQSFQYLTDVRHAVIADTVRSIGSAAFYGCTSLRGVVLPSRLDEIDISVFDHCSALRDVTLPEGVELIRNAAFNCCSELEWVYLPRSVVEIENSAFNGCYALTDVYYGGTQEEWNRIEIAAYNKYLREANIHYMSAALGGTYAQAQDGGTGLASNAYVDAIASPVDIGNNQYGVAALRADGMVDAFGFSDSFTETLAGWRDVTQIAQGGGMFIGLRRDGTVLAACTHDDLSDPEYNMMRETASWKGVRQLGLTNNHAFGLKEDGTLLVAGSPYYNAYPDIDFSDWKGIREIVVGSSSMGEFIVGIENDGDIRFEGIYDAVWYGTARNVTSVSCSGFLLLCLREDGTVVCTGLDAMQEISVWRDIQQVCAGDCLAVGLTSDGRVEMKISYSVIGDKSFGMEVGSWEKIRSIYLSRDNVLFAVDEEGHIKTAHPSGEMYTQKEEDFQSMREAVGSWQNVDRILSVNSLHVLAITKDGRLLGYGVTLPY